MGLLVLFRRGNLFSVFFLLRFVILIGKALEPLYLPDLDALVGNTLCTLPKIVP